MKMDIRLTLEISDCDAQYPSEEVVTTLEEVAAMIAEDPAVLREERSVTAGNFRLSVEPETYG